MARLIDAFGSPRAAMEASAKEISRRTGLSEKLARTIAEFSTPYDLVAKDVITLEKLGARVVTRWDADYPANLLEIYDPPALLFIRGSFAAEDRRAVAVVGTRAPSNYGTEMTGAMCRDLVRAGVTLVSGLARGIDTACHKAVVKAGGRTIGVLGCGIDVCYPRENGALVEEMLASGAVATEFRPGTPPLATNFYRRNRIVSGLAKGVLVVEATRNSGSLITAAHAVEQNRDVFAIPGSLTNKRSWGPHQLIKQGAGLVESADDIVKAVFSTAEPPRPGVQATLFEKEPDLPGLTETSQKVLEALDPDPVPIDSLVEGLGMDAGRLAGMLLDLELRGLVRQYPGKMFARVLR